MAGNGYIRPAIDHKQPFIAMLIRFRLIISSTGEMHDLDAQVLPRVGEFVRYSGVPYEVDRIVYNCDYASNREVEMGEPAEIEVHVYPLTDRGWARTGSASPLCVRSQEMGIKRCGPASKAPPVTKPTTEPT